MKRRLALCLAAVLLFGLFGCETGRGAPVTLRREKMTQAEAEWLPEEDETVVLDTELGSVRGIRRDGYLEFRGIPYATAERWAPAELVLGWEGVYDATRWGDRCAQYKGFYGTADSVVSQFYEDEALIEFPAEYSEDGLNLNLWVPEHPGSYPVLVYIHGGSFVKGSNSDPAIDGEVYARRGVILVSVNYRLGPFASAYGDEYTGNLALRDQITALHWIQNHIEEFGGDPAMITLMGESAGAIGVQNLLLSPLMEDGVIAGAIMLSGGGAMNAIGSPVLPIIPSAIWRKVKEVQGVGSISQLRDLPAEELFACWSAQLGQMKDLASQPVLDGTALNSTVSAALRQNRVKNVPVMIGMLSHDIVPHNLFVSAVEYGRERAKAGGEPVYLSYFERIPPGTPTFGAFHGADLYYVFGTLYRNRREFTDTDYRIAGQLIDYISNFVKTGDPNGEGLPRWEVATEECQQFLCFGDRSPVMIEPDEETLAQTQKTRPMFPFAPAIRPAQQQTQ